MTPADAEGSSFGPFPVLVDGPRIEAYVRATGDDPERWATAAPPGFAATALFTVAPAFLFDPEMSDWTRLLVHGDQHFAWHGPLVIGAYEVVGTVERVRMRQGTAFVTFGAALRHDAAVVLESRSTFLMGTEGPEPGQVAKEPDIDARGVNNTSGDTAQRSASRRDLVQYAAATGDFNPIHWDHDRAVAAGLPGIVCHGLLMTAWINQAAAGPAGGNAPLVDARYRFRNPLRPAEQATLTVSRGEDGRADAELSSKGGTVVSARVTVRT